MVAGPGLQQCTTKYSITKRPDGSTVTKQNNGQTFKEWASHQMKSTSPSQVFRNHRTSSSPVKMYATGSSSRLGRYGYETGPDGRIRSNQNYSQLRQHSATVIKPITINTADHTSCCSGAKKASAMEQVLAAMTAGVALYKQLDDLGAVDSAKDGLKTLFSKTPSSSEGDLCSKLDDAKSFSEIGKLEKQANTNKTNLNKDYQKTGDDAKNTIDDALKTAGVSEGLKLAGTSLDTSKLQLSTLDPEDLDASSKSVEKDLDTVKNFQEKDVAEAKTKVSEKKGQLTGSIKATNQSIDQLKLEKKQLEADNKSTATIDEKIAKAETKLRELENQQKQVTEAETAIKQADSACTTLIKNLNDQKTEIDDLKKFEGEVKDKKYDMAKDQDEKLGKDLKSMEKLNNKLNGLKGDDSKTESKRAEINKELKELQSELKDLTGSLADAGSTEFENSKGKKYTIKNLTAAQTAIASNNEPVSQAIIKDKPQNQDENLMA